MTTYPSEGEWTTEKPTKPGFYWYRKGEKVMLVNVYSSCGLPLDMCFHGSDWVEDVDEAAGEFWTAPIMPPKDIATCSKCGARIRFNPELRTSGMPGGVWEDEKFMFYTDHAHKPSESA